MSNWLDLSNNANCFKSMYIDGFLDISGGNIQTRGPNDNLIAQGDVSLNQNLYLDKYLSLGVPKYTNTYNYTVTANGPYVFNGEEYTNTNNPVLTFYRGSTYNLTINASGHPFWIQTTGGAYDSTNVYNGGITGAGTDSGVITFIVPYDAPDTLYYRCGAHGGMGNTINIQTFQKYGMDVSGVVDLSGDLYMKSGDISLCEFGISGYTQGTTINGINYTDTTWNQIDSGNYLTPTSGSSDYNGWIVSCNDAGNVFAVVGNQSNNGYVRFWYNNNGTLTEYTNNLEGGASTTQKNLGYVMQLSGDGKTVICGQGLNGSDNVVKVYKYSADIGDTTGTWTLLKSSGGSPHAQRPVDDDCTFSFNYITNGNDKCGYSVSINYDGTIVALGGESYVGVYKWDGTDWTLYPDNTTYEIFRSTPSSPLEYDSTHIDNNKLSVVTQNPTANKNYMGNITMYKQSGIGSQYHVKLNKEGNVLMTGQNGSFLKEDDGILAIYKLDGTTWKRQGKPIHTTKTDLSYNRMAESFDINDAGTVCIHGSGYRLTDTQAESVVRVYKNDSSDVDAAWTLDYEVVEANGWSGFAGASRNINYEVALNSTGDAFVLGQPSDTAYTGQGRIALYNKHNGVWTKRGDSDKTINGYYGWSLDMNSTGDVIIACAYGSNKAIVFNRNYEASYEQTPQYGYIPNVGNLTVMGDCSVNGVFNGLPAKISDATFNNDVIMQNRLFVNTSDLSYNGITGYSAGSYGGPYSLTTTYEGTSDATKASTPFICINQNGTHAVAPIKGNSNKGGIQIFELDGNSWVLRREFLNSTAGYYHGYGVKISADASVIALGQPGYNSFAGRVYIYTYDVNSPYTLTAVKTFEGDSETTSLGQTIALNSAGTMVVAGSNGQTRTYTYDGTNWNELSALRITGPSASVFSYRDIALTPDNNYLAVSADEYSSKRGLIRVYQYNSVDPSWNQIGSDLVGANSNIKFGNKLAISDDGTMLVGASPGRGLYANSGFVNIYDLSNNDWSQRGLSLQASSSGEGFGTDVAINSTGSIMAISANNSTGANDDSFIRVYESVDSSWNVINEFTDNTNLGYTMAMSPTGNAIVATNKEYGDYGKITFYNGTPGLGPPIYASVNDVDTTGNFSTTDISLNASLRVPGNITIVDNSANNYGAYITYAQKSGADYFNMGKSPDNVFNIVNQNNIGIYMQTGSNSFTVTSDERLKKDIELLENATDKVMQLKPCSYKWKTQTDEDTEKHVGFIAQEVEEVLPEVVNENEYPDGSKYKGVSTTDMIPYLIKMNNELENRLKELGN